MPSDSTSEHPLGIYSVLITGTLALVILTILLLLGLSVVGGIATDLGGDKDPRNKTAAPDPVTGQSVGFEDTGGAAKILEVFKVNDSTGYAVRLSGADDSYVQSRKRVSLAGDDTWSVSTWAKVNSTSSAETMTAVSANGRAVIQYNGSVDKWQGWYYDEGSTNSYLVNVSAPDQPGNLSLVTLTANSTHVTIYANTTQGEAQSLSSASIEDANLSASNWDGTLDETRVFDDATNDSEQSTLHANPVAPRPDRDRTARLMYDEGSGSTTAIYFGGTRADLSNHTWVRGLPGHVLTEGSDYTINTKDGRITALDGGQIDGAPVVWIDYRYQPRDQVGDVALSVISTFEFFSSASLIIPGVAILSVLLGGLYGAFRYAGNSGGFDGMFGGDRGNR